MIALRRQCVHLMKQANRTHVSKVFCSTTPSKNILPVLAAATDPINPIFPVEIEKLADEFAAFDEIDRRDIILCFEAKLGMENEVLLASSSEATSTTDDKPVEEKTSFDVTLKSFDAKIKIKVIKEVRAITGLGLKEAKELVESAPKTLKTGLKKEEAEALLEKLKEIGAVAEIE